MKKTIWANGLAVTAAALLASTGTANAALPTSMGSDSTFKVGVDIQPGVYKTTTALGVCAWARLSATTPGANATIEAAWRDQRHRHRRDQAHRRRLLHQRLRHLDAADHHHDLRLLGPGQRQLAAQRGQQHAFGRIQHDGQVVPSR